MRRTTPAVVALMVAAPCIMTLAACDQDAQTSYPAAAADMPNPREASEFADEWYRNYALYADGSRLHLAEETQPAAIAVVVEIEQPEQEQPTVVFIDPTLRAACDMEQPTAFFAFDSTEITDTNADLERLAQCLQEYPLADEYLEIVGHADPRGTEEYNRELGLDRAQTVYATLTSAGIDPERIDTYSRGEYFASSDPEDWDGNRRVTIRLDE
jgi:outer membrane protein OmpA-like peptidoglycan-associated protein